MDRHEIEANISRLESGGTTWNNVEKLALLYTVREHLDTEAAPRQARRPAVAASYSAAPETDFVQAARQADYELLLQVLNEHMEAIRLLYPREYEAVMRKILMT